MLSRRGALGLFLGRQAAGRWVGGWGGPQETCPEPPRFFCDDRRADQGSAATQGATRGSDMADPSPGGTQNTEQERTWWETSLSDVSALTAASRRCECGQETTKMHQFALDQHLTSDNHRRKMKQPSFKRAPGYEPHKDTTKQQKLCFKRARSTPSPSCASCVCTHRQPSPCAACTHPELHPALPARTLSSHPALLVRTLNSHPALSVRTLSSHPASALTLRCLYAS